MGWRRALFKGKKVWVEVDAAGEPKATGGRVPMRYAARAGAKVYGAGLRNVAIDSSAPIEDLDAGVSADQGAGGSRGPKKGGRGRGFGSAGTRTQAQKQAAIKAAEELIADLGPTVHIAYTDGACRGNPGPAGSGVFLQLADGRYAEASASLGRATNNVGELTAIGLALELLDEAEVPKDADVAVLTDSSYSHGVLVKGWKAKANAALIADIRDALQERPGVTIHWVAGHVGLTGNERADTLANRGVDGVTDTTWHQAS